MEKELKKLEAICSDPNEPEDRKFRAAFCAACLVLAREE